MIYLMIGGITGKKVPLRDIYMLKYLSLELVVLSVIGGKEQQWNNLKQLCINLDTYKEENGESHICLVGY